MAMLAHSISNERKAIRCVNPADGSDIGEVPIASAEEVRAAVARARAAQPAWRALGARGRYARICAFVETAIAEHERVMDLVRKENGKPLIEAVAELAVALMSAHHFGKLARKLEKGKSVRRGLLPSKRDRIAYPPLGVVAVISPWNYPILLAYWQILPALLAGNAVVHKPSEHTPMMHLLLGEMMRKAGAPLETITGDGATGAALCEAGVDTVTFTGSLGTGRKVMAACAKGPIPCLLELGGKDPLVVLEDANVDRAVAAAVTCGFVNTGQQCVATERVYVHRKHFDAFVQKAVERTRAMRMGEDYGPMTTSLQLDIVDRHVREAVEKGAKALTGGKRMDRPGYWYEPTVLVDVNHEMAVMREETFGPVLPIMPFDDDAEALRLANDSNYGLAASVFGSGAHARRVAGELEVGMVSVNDVFSYAFNPRLPWGGAKQSGVGRAMAEEGFTKYCRVTSVSEDQLGLSREIFWPPYTPRGLWLMKAALALQTPSVWTRVKRLLGGW